MTHATGRVEVLASAHAFWGLYWELARTADGRFIVWRERYGTRGSHATIFDSEPEAREFFLRYTTPIVEQRA